MSDITVTLAPPAVIEVTLEMPAPIAVTLSGTQGPSGPQGLKGDTGAIGPASNPSVIFPQPVAASTWTIAHNLGRYPTVILVDTSGNQVEADVNYVDSNNILASFSEPFAGSAYLN